ncbi:MAG: MBL fold metallo-hydrolase [Phycisphaerae bacterium]|nr:MBL fold metallo-hydrolase [Phycisphaerae bacterium]
MISLTVLASGSAANCSALVVHDDDGAILRLVLIDAGLSPRAAKDRLYSALQRSPETSSDIVLTHLDADHYRDGWNRVLRRHPIRLHVHRAHVREAMAAGIPESSICPFDERIDFGDDLVAETVRTPHDDRGTVAYVFERRARDRVARVGFATDLGRVPSTLFERFRDLDILAIESNYDPELQRLSPRPAFLKDRIMGGRGHLSNEESLAASLRVDRASDLKKIVLLHLSRQCNCPSLVERLWRQRAPHLHERLVVAAQHQATATVSASARAARPCEAEALLF